MSDTSSEISRPEKAWIILIGIDEYQQYDINDLHGCVRDVDNVESFFQMHFHNVPRQVRKLTSNLSGQNVPTLENVIREIESVKQNVGVNDFVYFHFSGHGGRKSRGENTYNNPGAYLECLILQKGEIIDYQLGSHFDELAAKGANLFVVLDCCHSGGGDRYDSQNIRQINHILPADHESGIIPKPTAIKGQDSDRAGSIAPSRWTAVRNYTLLAACHPEQFAKECDGADNNKNGALTLTMLSSINTLRHNGQFLTYKSLYSDIRAKIGLKSPGQVPMLFGKIDRPIFSLGTQLTTRHATVMSTEITDKGDIRICIDQGSIHGVYCGEQWHLYSHGDIQMKNPITTITIDDVKAIQAFATVPTGLNVQRGCILSLDSQVYGNPLPVFVENKVLREMLTALPNMGVTFLSNGATDYKILPDGQGKHQVFDSTHTPMRNSPTYTSTENMDPGTDTLNEFIRFLKPLAHCWRLIKLENGGGDLKDEFEFCCPLSGKAGEIMELTFENKRPKTRNRFLENEQNKTRSLYIAIFNIRTDRTVDILVPHPVVEGFDSVAVAPGETHKSYLKFSFLLEDGDATEITDIFKVIVTDKAVSFASLATANLFRSGNTAQEDFNTQFGLMLQEESGSRAAERCLPPESTKWQTATRSVAVTRG